MKAQRYPSSLSIVMANGSCARPWARCRVAIFPFRQSFDPDVEAARSNEQQPIVERRSHARHSTLNCLLTFTLPVLNGDLLALPCKSCRPRLRSSLLTILRGSPAHRSKCVVHIHTHARGRSQMVIVQSKTPCPSFPFRSFVRSYLTHTFFCKEKTS